MRSNEVCDEIREAKISFEYGLAQNIEENLKTLYAFVRSRSKSRRQIGSLRWKDKIVDDDGG